MKSELSSFLAIQSVGFVPGASPKMTASPASKRLVEIPMIGSQDALVTALGEVGMRYGRKWSNRARQKGEIAEHRRYLSFLNHHLVEPYHPAGSSVDFDKQRFACSVNQPLICQVASN